MREKIISMKDIDKTDALQIQEIYEDLAWYWVLNHRNAETFPTILAVLQGKDYIKINPSDHEGRAGWHIIENRLYDGVYYDPYDDETPKVAVEDGKRIGIRYKSGLLGRIFNSADRLSDEDSDSFIKCLDAIDELYGKVIAGKKLPDHLGFPGYQDVDQAKSQEGKKAKASTPPQATAQPQPSKPEPKPESESESDSDQSAATNSATSTPAPTTTLEMMMALNDSNIVEMLRKSTSTKRQDIAQKLVEDLEALKQETAKKLEQAEDTVRRTTVAIKDCEQNGLSFDIDDSSDSASDSVSTAQADSSQNSQNSKNGANKGQQQAQKSGKNQKNHGDGGRKGNKNAQSTVHQSDQKAQNQQQDHSSQAKLDKSGSNHNQHPGKAQSQTIVYAPKLRAVRQELNQRLMDAEKSGCPSTVKNLQAEIEELNIARRNQDADMIFAMWEEYCAEVSTKPNPSSSSVSVPPVSSALPKPDQAQSASPKPATATSATQPPVTPQPAPASQDNTADDATDDTDVIIASNPRDKADKTDNSDVAADDDDCLEEKLAAITPRQSVTSGEDIEDQLHHLTSQRPRPAASDPSAASSNQKIAVSEVLDHCAMYGVSYQELPKPLRNVKDDKIEISLDWINNWLRQQQYAEISLEEEEGVEF